MQQSPFITTTDALVPATALTFTSKDLAAIQQSFDDFKHGRTLSLEEVEADTLAHIASFNTWRTPKSLTVQIQKHNRP